MEPHNSGAFAAPADDGSSFVAVAVAAEAAEAAVAGEPAPESKGGKRRRVSRGRP